MSLRQILQCVQRCPTLTLLDSTQLPLGDSFHFCLRNACFFAEFANGDTVPAVEVSTSLQGLVQFERVCCLQELVPAQMDVGNRPMDEGPIGIDPEVPEYSRRQAPQCGNRRNGHVQEPLLRASD